MQNNEEELLIEPHALVKRWITAFNAHDVATIVSLYHDDAELFDSGMSRPRRGRVEIEHWFRWRFSSTPITYTPTQQSFTEDGQIVVAWIAQGRGPRFLNWLANSFKVDGKSYFTLQDGLIQRQRGVYDHLAVLKQIIPLLKWFPSGCAHFIYRIYLWRGKQ
jgi:hypothetical protein